MDTGKLMRRIKGLADVQHVYEATDYLIRL